MNKFCYLFFIIFLVFTLVLPSISSDTFDDCTIYGNCEPITSLNSTGLIINWTSVGEPLWTTNWSIYNSTWGNITNMSYVPYTGARTNVDIGNHNFTLNKTILWSDGVGERDLWWINDVSGDGFKMQYFYNFHVANDDWFIFNKMDGNDPNPDGGIAFMMTNSTGWNKTIIELDGYGNANFTDYNIYTTNETQTNTLVVSSNTTARDIFPFQTSTYDLGMMGLVWKNLFVHNVSANYISVWNDLNVSGNAEITGNLHVDGNFSAKRPYWNGYDNSTQNFLNVSEAQVMNLTAGYSDDHDSWLIDIKGRTNITFQQTGDYLIVVSPEFYQATGSQKTITFWIRKNGVDVPWSNSRYSMANGEYTAPAITYQVDITNTANDNIQVMWWSDSTASQIISISGLTNPTRPSIPGVLINIQKVSEITD